MEFENKIEFVLNRIKGLHSTFDSVITDYRKAIAEYEQHNPGDFYTSPPEYWVLVIRCDALVKLRIFLERNFTYIETLSLLATTRYVFELSVWLRAIKLDKNYAIYYVHKLVDGAEEHSKQLYEQLIHEVSLLKSFQRKDDDLTNQCLEKLKHEHASPEEMDKATRRISETIDAEAAIRFSLYGEEAVSNGYGLQVHLIESKAIPRAKFELEEAQKSKEQFNDKWKKMAKNVGMEDEHNYIYSYTSRLLHAKPSSLTTNQKSLESPEVYVFLRYCFVKITEMLEDGTEQLSKPKMH